MEARWQELKRYVRLSDDDAAHIASFRESASPHFRRIVREFYDRIREHEEAHAVFIDEDQIERLQVSMVRWLERVFGGSYDAAYFAQTEHIGRVHVNVGLPQRYMVTAMSLIRSALSSLVDSCPHTANTAAVRDALSRLLDIELTVMLESYHEHLAARVANAAAVARRSQVALVEDRCKSLLDVAAILAIGLDDAGRILLFNREAERVTGYARDEVLGRSFADLFLVDGAVDASGPGFGLEQHDGYTDAALRTRAGKHRDIRWQIVRSKTPTEAHGVSVYAIGADVTEELSLRHGRAQQERLAAIGTLAAGLAHEIRNPLNGAQLHVSFLERTLVKSKSSEEAVEAVHVVQDEIQRLANLVTEFLDFARPRPLARSKTNLRAICERTIELVRGDAEAAKVELRLDLPDGEVVMEADGHRLEQVLLNLVQNAVQAIEATSDGIVLVRVRREPRHVTIDVEDDGPGLPTSDAPIFDAFYSTKPSGTGLGLAIVHRIVTDHGGTIKVESRPGRTRFRMRLPITELVTLPVLGPDGHGLVAPSRKN